MFIDHHRLLLARSVRVMMLSTKVFIDGDLCVAGYWLITMCYALYSLIEAVNFSAMSFG
jgi:hypothetical protein